MIKIKMLERIAPPVLEEKNKDVIFDSESIEYVLKKISLSRVNRRKKNKDTIFDPQNIEYVLKNIQKEVIGKKRTRREKNGDKPSPSNRNKHPDGTNKNETDANNPGKVYRKRRNQRNIRR